MNGSLQTHLARAAELLGEHAGETVIYQRGATAVGLVARPQNADWAAENDQGIVELWEGLDWVVSAAEWDRGEFDEPARGDLIVRTVAGVQHRYGVMSPRGRQLFEVTANREYVIIHTKEIAP